MHSARMLLVTGAMLLAAFSLVACGGGGDTAEQEQDAKLAADWAGLKETKKTLEEKRQEHRGLLDKITGKVPADTAEGEDAAATPTDETSSDAEPPSPEELRAQADALKKEIDTLAVDFGARLADFINSQEIEVGTPLTEIQTEALHFNSDEAIVNARDFIEKGGDYQRALDIYRQALLFDPDYEKLKEARDEAEELRYMSEERFAQVKKKMTQQEVRNLLGQIKNTNARDFPEKNVLGWFYPKEDGGAAGVYFRERKKGEGNWEVYSADYDAVKPQVIGGESDPDDADAPTDSEGG